MDQETINAIEARAIETEKRLAANIKTEVATLGAQFDVARATWGKKLRALIETYPRRAADVCFGLGFILGATIIPAVRSWF